MWHRGQLLGLLVLKGLLLQTLAKETIRLPDECGVSIGEIPKIKYTNSSISRPVLLPKDADQIETLFHRNLIVYRDVKARRCYLVQGTQDIRPSLLRSTSGGLSKTQVCLLGGRMVQEFCRDFRTRTAKSKRISNRSTKGKGGLYKKYRNRRNANGNNGYTYKTNPRGKYRGQTQSQYLNVGSNGSNPGRAEAESTREGSRAVVSGTSGMGQAQSQSFGSGCEDCYDRQNQGIAVNGGRFRYPGQGPDSGGQYGNNGGRPDTLIDKNRPRPKVDQPGGPVLPPAQTYRPDGQYPPDSSPKGPPLTHEKDQGSSKFPSPQGQDFAPGQTLSPGQQPGYYDPNKPNIFLPYPPSGSERRPIPGGPVRPGTDYPGGAQIPGLTPQYPRGPTVQGGDTGAGGQFQVVYPGGQPPRSSHPGQGGPIGSQTYPGGPLIDQGSQIGSTGGQTTYPGGAYPGGPQPPPRQYPYPDGQHPSGTRFDQGGQIGGAGGQSRYPGVPPRSDVPSPIGRYPEGPPRADITPIGQTVYPGGQYQRPHIDPISRPGGLDGHTYPGGRAVYPTEQHHRTDQGVGGQTTYPGVTHPSGQYPRPDQGGPGGPVTYPGGLYPRPDQRGPGGPATYPSGQYPGPVQGGPSGPATYPSGQYPGPVQGGPSGPATYPSGQYPSPVQGGPGGPATYPSGQYPGPVQGGPGGPVTYPSGQYPSPVQGGPGGPATYPSGQYPSPVQGGPGGPATYPSGQYPGPVQGGPGGSATYPSPVQGGPGGPATYPSGQYPSPVQGGPGAQTTYPSGQYPGLNQGSQIGDISGQGTYPGGNYPRPDQRGQTGATYPSGQYPRQDQNGGAGGHSTYPAGTYPGGQYSRVNQGGQTTYTDTYPGGQQPRPDQGRQTGQPTYPGSQYPRLDQTGQTGGIGGQTTYPGGTYPGGTYQRPDSGATYPGERYPRPDQGGQTGGIEQTTYPGRQYPHPVDTYPHPRQDHGGGQSTYPAGQYQPTDQGGRTGGHPGYQQPPAGSGGYPGHGYQDPYGSGGDGRYPGRPGGSTYPPGEMIGPSKINPTELVLHPGSQTGYPSGQTYPDQTSRGPAPSAQYDPRNQGGGQWTGSGKDGYPQLGPDGKPISSYDDDGSSQAETSIQQIKNETQISAMSNGRLSNGLAQSQVSGTYSQSGSFSAQAQTSDGNKGAQSQISVGKLGSISSAQGNAGFGQSQAQIQLGSDSGGTTAEAQSGGWNHGTNTQVQASTKGGMADAQANGPGSTSSQAQIGFQPYQEANDSDNQNAPFYGGGMASAQSGKYAGQSQTQIQGKFKYGISYNGAAQAGSGSKDNSPRNRTAFKPIDLVSGHSVRQDREINLQTTERNKQVKDDKEAMQEAESRQSAQPHLEGHSSDSRKYQKTQESKLIKTDDDFEDNYDGDDGEEDFDEEPDFYVSPEANTENRQRSPKHKDIVVQQAGKNQKQHIILGPLTNNGAHVIQDSSNVGLKEGMVFQPGETVPGTQGYTIPIGFRGRVSSVSHGNETYSYSDENGESQAQTVNLTPGSRNITYTKSPLKMQPALKSWSPSDDRYSRTNYYNPDSYVTVTKSETGELNKNNPEDNKKYSHTYYTKSSTCGYFTFSCNIVYGSNGRTKICKPKTHINPDGSPADC